MRKTGTLFALILLLVTAFSSRAAEVPALEVAADRPEAIYKKGEPVSFRIALKPGEKTLGSETVEYKILRDGVGVVDSGTVKASADKPATARATLHEPGFLRCEVTYKTAATTQPVTAVAAAAFDPSEIKPALPPPEDFDVFWTKQKLLLVNDPPKPVLTAVESKADGVEAFDVQVNCPGGAPLSGYFARPKGAAKKSLPAILYPHSAGVRSSDLPHAVRGAKMNLLALDFNAHGIPNGQPDRFYADLLAGRLKGYSAIGRDSVETVYFRAMILRLLRAIDFLTAQPEWDGQVLIVQGSSQGGGQALVAAGLDPRVTLCLASVPALCDHAGYKLGRQPGWPRIVPKTTGGQYDENVTQVARYVDAANFATRIKCPTHVTVGFIDHVCAPVSVYAAFNVIPIEEKYITPRPAMGHTFPKDLQSQFDDVLRAHITEIKGAGSKY